MRLSFTISQLYAWIESQGLTVGETIKNDFVPAYGHQMDRLEFKPFHVIASNGSVITGLDIYLDGELLDQRLGNNKQYGGGIYAYGPKFDRSTEQPVSN